MDRILCHGVAASATDTVERIDALLKLQRSYQETIRAMGGRGVISEVADLLIGLPWVSISQLARKTGRTFPAVNTAVERLVGLGILEEATGRTYGRLFVAPAVMQIYSAPASL